MTKNELDSLDNKELFELLATLEGMDDALNTLENTIKESSDEIEIKY